MNSLFTKRVLVGISIFAAASTAYASADNSAEAIARNKAYSPYANARHATNVYWGESHLHTGLSLDAGLWGNTIGLDETYQFARGKQITSSTGIPVKLARPLDWAIITDHTDLMGFATDLQKGAPNILADKKGKEWYDKFQLGGKAAGEAAFDLITHFSQMTLPEKLVTDYSPGAEVFEGVWEDIIDAAERNNEPGLFTAFIGFEWTSVPKGFNLHRNVIIRDNGDVAKKYSPRQLNRLSALPIHLTCTNGLRPMNRSTAAVLLPLHITATCQMAGCSPPRPPMPAV